MRVGIVGAGISGLLAARLLQRDHDVHVFDSRDRYGGNAQTVTVQENGTPVAVDVGACMFYRPGYPNFFKMLRLLGVPTTPLRLHIRLAMKPNGTEYSLDLNNRLWTALRVLRNKDTRHLCREGLVWYRDFAWCRSKIARESTLGEYLESRGFSEEMCSIVVGMAMLIWTVESDDALQFPASFVFSSLKDLGIWGVLWPTQWRRVPGGTRRYLDALTAPIRDRISLGVNVERVVRERDRVILACNGHGEAVFDEVIFAISAETALALIDNPTPSERRILGTFVSTTHSVGLGSDEPIAAPYRNGSESAYMNVNLIPRSASRIPKIDLDVGFFDLRRLQNLQLKMPLFLSYLPVDRPRPENLLEAFNYATPVFSAEVLAAQREHANVSGVNRLHFCGAGWNNGLHEGGVVSTLNVAKRFGKSLDNIVER